MRKNNKVRYEKIEKYKNNAIKDERKEDKGS